MMAVRWRARLGFVGAIFIATVPSAQNSALADDRAAHSIADKFAQDSQPDRKAHDAEGGALERKLQEEERLKADELEMLERAKTEAEDRKAEDGRRAVEEAEAAARTAEEKRQADDAEDRAARERAAREAVTIKETADRNRAELERATAEAAKAKADREQAEAKQREIEAEKARVAAEAEAKAKADREQAEAKQREIEAEKARVAAEAEAKAKADREQAEAKQREIEAAKVRIEEAKRADIARRKAEEDAAQKREAEAAKAQLETAQRAEEQRRMEAEREAEARRLSEKLARARELREAKGQPDGLSALGGPDPVETRPQPAAPSALTRDKPGESVASSPKPAGTTETRATILLVMEPGTNGIRRHEKTADPVICIGTQCFISNGIEDPATAMTRARALGPGNTLGQRAGACRHTLVCVFRDVDVGSGLIALQPVDMRILRHDRREIQLLKIDPTCKVERGQLRCDKGARTSTYRAWIVPESVARQAGAAALSVAMAEGMPGNVAAAGSQH